MIPILYAKNETAFDSLGIGPLTDIISASVTEERNGPYELTLTYPVTGVHFSELTEGALVKAKPNETSNPQLFRIYKTSRPIGGIVTYNAEHISYDLLGLPVLPYHTVGTSAAAAINDVLTRCPIQNGFTAWTDITSLLSMSIDEPRSVRNFCGGQRGSVLDTFGGEFEWDNFTIKLHASRGRDNGVVLNYGKNLTSAKQERNIQATYTHFCPYAKYSDDNGEHIVTLTEEVIQLINPEDIGHAKALTKDITSEFPSGTAPITEEMLREKADSYIAKNSLGVPKVNLKVSFVQIWDSPEYARFQNFEHVRLCDTVTVRFTELGINASAKVVKTVYDVLAERYNSIDLGTLRSNLADTISDLEEEIASNDVTAIRSEVAAQIDAATQAITGNSGGYVVLHPAQHPSEIYIMDTDDINTAQKVWRWNNGGLGYSSTGAGGPFTTAITSDGKIVADFIKTGALNAIDIMACTITGGNLNINDKFVVDAEGNCHMEGYVKATSGEIGGCSIVDGVLNVPAANVDGKCTADQINADGIIANNVVLSGAISATEGTFSGTVDTDTAIIRNATVEELTTGNINNSGDLSTDTMSSNTATIGTIVGSGESSAAFTCYTRACEYRGAVAFSPTLDTVTVRITLDQEIPSRYNAEIPVYIRMHYIVETDPYRQRIDRTISGTVTLTGPSIPDEHAYNHYLTGTFRTQTIDYNDDYSVHIDSVGLDIFGAQEAAVTFKPMDASGEHLLILDNTVLVPKTHSSSTSVGLDVGQSTRAFRTMHARTFRQISSRKYKDHIEDLDEKQSAFFKALKPRKYRYKDDTETHYGMIMDEVWTAMQSAGLSYGDFAGYCPDDPNEPMGDGGLAYDEFVALLIAEVQKLNKRVEELANLIDKEKTNG